jgi:hypothetical protein
MDHLGVVADKRVVHPELALPDRGLEQGMSKDQEEEERHQGETRHEFGVGHEVDTSALSPRDRDHGHQALLCLGSR